LPGDSDQEWGMFRNYLSAALGNIGRNGLYAAITILGLTVSFTAAILIGLYVRDEYSFEKFIPGWQDVYRLEFDLTLPGQKGRAIDGTVSSVAANFRLDFPEAQQVARFTATGSSLKLGEVATPENVVWADPGLFKVMPLPVLAGDANAALEAPDGIVLTRAMARKYFGQDAPIGKVLMVDTGLNIPGSPLGGFHPMRVMAVLKDIPSNSHLAATIFASARAPYSLTSLDDQHPSPFSIDHWTYVRLKPGVSAASLEARVKNFGERHYRGGGPGGSSAQHFRLMPLKTLHFTSGGDGRGLFRPRGDRNVDAAVAAVGMLIVLIAAINFVTLMTARASRRAVEVGIRKAVGARRRDLVAQFMGEALIYVLVAMVLAVGLAEVILPAVNAFLQRTMTLDLLTDPALAAAIAGGALMTALLAGAYPSLLLSAFLPTSALKGGPTQTVGAAVVRQVLVVAQFAILIGLIVMTGTIYRQTRFALNDALRVDTSQVALMGGACRSAFATELKALRGVKAESCASGVALGRGMSNSIVTMPDRSQRTVQTAPVDVGFFELQGLKPLAGRFFSKSAGQDMVLDRPTPAGPDAQPSVVLNESAARVLGFARPADAVGKTVSWTRWSASTDPTKLPPPRPSQVVGVVRDFTLGSIRTAIEPTVYHVEPSSTGVVLFKLDGRAIPETLAAINRLWRQTGNGAPAQLAFENQAMQALYADVITQGIVIAVCAGLAIFIACIGLFALAAFTTERRTKEIGVRKAMGASTLNVVTLLLSQFSQPVLWANLIAWPAAWWAMSQWLKGFAYRVDMPLWLFAAAMGLAVLIALLTVSAHTWLVARAKPVGALRYE
jgi:putative ABC transport system permease protein